MASSSPPPAARPLEAAQEPPLKPAQPAPPQSELIIIHVCDEARQINRDFACDRGVLLEEMRYFQSYLGGDSGNFDDIDISVHCDVRGGRAEVLPVGSDEFAMYVKRTAPAVRRGKNQHARSSRGRETGLDARRCTSSSGSCSGSTRPRGRRP